MQLKREKRGGQLYPSPEHSNSVPERGLPDLEITKRDKFQLAFFFFFNNEHQRGKKRRRQTRSSWRGGNTETGISMLNIQTSLKSCLNLTSTVSVKMRNKVIFLFTLMDFSNVLAPAVFRRLGGVSDKVVVSHSDGCWSLTSKQRIKPWLCKPLSKWKTSQGTDAQCRELITSALLITVITSDTIQLSCSLTRVIFTNHIAPLLWRPLLRSWSCLFRHF